LAFPAPKTADLELAVEAEVLAQISLLARISQLVRELAKASAENNHPSPLPRFTMSADEYLYCTL
jgi:hypothetical protein